MLEDLSERAGLSASGSAHAKHALDEHLALAAEQGSAMASLLRLCAPTSAMELALSNDGTVVAVTTHGRGSDFTARVRTLLERCEIDATALAQVLMLAQALNHARCLVKLICSAQQLEVEIRWRRALHLDHAARLIGMNASAWNEVESFAALLHKTAVGGVSLTMRPRSLPVRPAVLFAQVVSERRREQVRMRLAHAVSRHAPCAPAVTRWVEHHDALLAHARTLLSVWLTPGAAVADTRIGIEYPDVTVPAAAAVLEHRAGEVERRFAALCRRAGCASLSCLEVGLQAAAEPRLCGYVSVES